MSPTTWLILKCVLIVLITALVLVRYARACECEICGNSYAVYRRRPYPGEAIDLCRHHAKRFDQASRFHQTRLFARRPNLHVVRSPWRPAT
jgi:hypothetical protein